MNPSVKIDGEWRNVYAPYAKIDGEWHTGDIYTKIDGVWVQTYKHRIEASDILGFRMIYRRSIYGRHPNHPNIVDNPEVPHIFDLTGKNTGQMDITEKGVVYEYTNDDPDVEGICAYEGRLYAAVRSGMLIDVTNDGMSIPSPVGMTYGSDRINHLEVVIDGAVSYQCFGYYMAGWNSLFNQNEVIDRTVFPDIGPHEHTHIVDRYNLLTPEHRENTFANVALIGIARDMSSPMTNMVGNHGKLSQSIYSISIDGVPFPFSVEIQT